MTKYILVTHDSHALCAALVYGADVINEIAAEDWAPFPQGTAAGALSDK